LETRQWLGNFDPVRKRFFRHWIAQAHWIS